MIGDARGLSLASRASSADDGPIPERRAITMSSPPTQPSQDPLFNPYAAPEAEIGGPAMALTGSSLAEAEAIRRAHLNHEVTVKGFGALSVLGGIFMLIAAPFLLAMGLGAIPLGESAEPGAGRYFLAGLGVMLFALGLLNIFVGIGMRRLQPWARWTETVLVSINLLASLFQINPVALLISGYILYLMVSAKGEMIFSRRYKEVIALTPHIKYKMSRWVKTMLWVLLAFFVVLIGLAIVGALMNR
jgi:hypothetical protein